MLKTETYQSGTVIDNDEFESMDEVAEGME